MTAYRKRPVIIHAQQWDGTRAHALEIKQWFSCFDPPLALTALDFAGSDDKNYFAIHTLEGSMRVSPGDWVIRGVQGELYPCRPDIFAATYEEMDE